MKENVNYSLEKGQQLNNKVTRKEVAKASKEERKALAENLDRNPNFTIDSAEWADNQLVLSVARSGGSEKFQNLSVYESASTEFIREKWSNIRIGSNLATNAGDLGKGVDNKLIEDNLELYMRNKLNNYVKTEVKMPSKDKLKKATKEMTKKYLSLKPVFKITGRASFDGNYESNRKLAKKRMDEEINKLKKMYGEDISIEARHMVLGPDGKEIKDSKEIEDAWIDLLASYMREVDDKNVVTIKQIKNKLRLFDKNPNKLTEKEIEFFNLHITEYRGVKTKAVIPKENQDAQFAFRFEENIEQYDNDDGMMLASK